MDARAAARRWTTTWERAWASGAVDPIPPLYADGARVRIAPFRDPAVGPDGVRAYLERTFADEASVRPRFDEPIVDGTRAAVRWWATLLEAGAPITLAGISWLAFDADGLVTAQWDAWGQLDRHADPPDGWPG